MARRNKSTEDQSNEENINESDDNFGLPEIEYEPLNRDEELAQDDINQTTTDASPEESSHADEEASKELDYEDEEFNEDGSVYNDTVEPSGGSAAPKVIGIIVVLLLVGSAIWYLKFYKPGKDAAERAKQELLSKQESERRKAEQRLADLKRQEDEQRRADSLANAAPKEGSVEVLSERTRRYYVVVASAIDDDLIMDHAKELSKKGVRAMIIPPFGKTQFYRLAVAVGDTYPDAQATADGLKALYGDGAWVVKY